VVSGLAYGNPKKNIGTSKKVRSCYPNRSRHRYGKPAPVVVIGALGREAGNDGLPQVTQCIDGAESDVGMTEPTNLVARPKLDIK
jgi:hypothetical protein